MLLKTSKSNKQRFIPTTLLFSRRNSHFSACLSLERLSAVRTWILSWPVRLQMICQLFLRVKVCWTLCARERGSPGMNIGVIPQVSQVFKSLEAYFASKLFTWNTKCLKWASLCYKWCGVAYLQEGLLRLPNKLEGGMNYRHKPVWCLKLLINLLNCVALEALLFGKRITAKLNMSTT